MYLQWVLKWMDIHLSYVRKTQKTSVSLIIHGSLAEQKTGTNMYIGYWKSSFWSYYKTILWYTNLNLFKLVLFYQ